MEGFSQENPLGLPGDAQGQVHQLRIDTLKGNDQDLRYNACAVFCGILNTLPNGATSFNNLTQPQQIIAVRIREEQQGSHRVLEYFLRAPQEFREIAITSTEHNPMNSTIMVREVQLGHIAEYL